MKILLAYGSGPARIDDMKVFGGVSNGRTGEEILKNIYPGSEVHVLANSAKPTSGSCVTRKFRTWDEYQTLLYSECETWHPDIVICAVAVSNFTPSSVIQWPADQSIPFHSLGPVKGKVDTRVIDRLTIEMVKTPSVIGGVRERIGKQAVLVGFKLTSCGDKAACIEHARVVLREAKCDLVIANDLKLGLDRKFFVLPTGVFEGLAFETLEIAEYIVEAKKSGFYQSFGPDAYVLPPKEGEAWDTARVLYPRLKPHLTETPEGMLHGCFAVRHSKDGFVTTSRGKLVQEEMPLTSIKYVSFRGKQVTYVHGRATLNAPILAQIFEARPDVQTIIHLHRYYRGAVTLPYAPPGTDGERALGVLPGPINIRGHGAIVPFNHTDIDAIMAVVEDESKWEDVA